MQKIQLFCDDSLERMRLMEANSVDCIVTDPPYGLSFMGKKWDYDVPSVALWTEALRVLKPGGHLLSFGGTRTYHRMVVNIEDAGFEIRDQIMWLYGSGFPKSMDISKAIDKAAGAERTEFTIDEDFLRRNPGHKLDGIDRKKEYSGTEFKEGLDAAKRFAPATNAAKQWAGWGTALKPANEPIVLARKPLSESTVAKNVLKWGTGGLNIDGSRIGEGGHHGGRTGAGNSSSYDLGKEYVRQPNQIYTQGRWPANILLDEVAAAVLDEQTQHLHGAGSKRKAEEGTHSGGDSLFGKIGGPAMRFGDSGGASRFFYVAKASKRERNAGLEGMPQVTARSGLGGKMPVDDNGQDRDRFQSTQSTQSTQSNHHPTVKPIKLMEYLIKLVCPPEGIVLDPFMGSGTTGVAAKNLGFSFVGVERESEYVSIADKRINPCDSPK